MIPFFDVYGAIIAWVFSGETELNKRTGMRIKVGRGGTAFRVDLSDGVLPTIGFRRTFPKSAAAEVAWYLSGQQDAAFIRRHTPMWDKFVEPIFPMLPEACDAEQGCEPFEGVKAAYGYRWRNHFGRDQIGLTIEALKQDPSNRRCYVSAWDPSEDGLSVLGQRNVPCPVGFTFNILNGELHSSITLRSSDVFVGLPYDVMGHALLMDAVAHQLRLRPGVMHVTLAHAHLYESHWDLTTEMMEQEPVVPQMPLPGWTLSQIERAPDDYVDRYWQEARLLTWPSYNPRPDVVE